LRDNNVADRTIQRLTEQAPKIDALWLSGEAFQQLLEQWVVPNTPTRYVHLKAEYEPRFERGQAVEGFTEDEDGMGDGEGAAAEASSRLDLSEFSALYRPAQRLSRNLQQYRQVDPSWRAVKMLRIPSNQYGGYDLYSWGKMTYRSPDFREGVGKLRFVTDLYEKITQAIESLVWMHAEETEPGGARRVHGLPVVFQFDQMLAAGTFENFIDQTFEQRKGPFRLWGNPIAVGPGRFHVYGVDLHMWQQVYMELSLDRFLFVLPRGTCGNTIHRLMTNIQRFLDPGVKMTIGETDYGGMVRNALFDREVINA